MTKELLENLIHGKQQMTPEIAGALVVEYGEKVGNRTLTGEQLQALLPLLPHANWNHILNKLAELNGLRIVTITWQKDNSLVCRYVEEIK